MIHAALFALAGVIRNGAGNYLSALIAETVAGIIYMVAGRRDRHGAVLLDRRHDGADGTASLPGDPRQVLRGRP